MTGFLVLVVAVIIVIALIDSGTHSCGVCFSTKARSRFHTHSHAGVPVCDDCAPTFRE